MSSGKGLSIKRINKDLKEIEKSPIEGIGIASLDNDPMKYVVNLCIMSGIYEGYCLQLLLTFPVNYPIKPPKILIYPDQAIDYQYHHCIYQDTSKDENNHYFKKLCFGLLDNEFEPTSFCWNPSYSISSLLLQVQNFIGDPNMSSYSLPNKREINELMKSMKDYKREFLIKDENGESKKCHTWKNPYPEIFYKKDKNNKMKDTNKDNKNEDELKMILIKDNLTCFLQKLNYIDEPEISLGYPIIQKKGLDKNKIDLYPIPELLTYEGFMAQIGEINSKVNLYFNTNFSYSCNNYWIPIYIDTNHYLKNRSTILYSFSIIKYGVIDIKQYDFKPEQIFEIFPIILNKLHIGMLNGDFSISSSFIRCYFHYVILFKKLSIELEEEYIKYLNKKLNQIRKNKYEVSKSIIPDIVNFIILLFFCNKDIHNNKMKKIWYCLFEEFLTRQIYRIFYYDNNLLQINENLLSKIIKQKKVFETKDYKEKLDKKKKDLERKCFEEGRCFIKVDDNKSLVDFLYKKNFQIFNRKKGRNPQTNK